MADLCYLVKTILGLHRNPIDRNQRIAQYSHCFIDLLSKLRSIDCRFVYLEKTTSTSTRISICISPSTDESNCRISFGWNEGKIDRSIDPSLTVFFTYFLYALSTTGFEESLAYSRYSSPEFIFLCLPRIFKIIF